MPGASGSAVNFGLTAAEALAAGAIDGFWANGMATELAATTRCRHHRVRGSSRRWTDWPLQRHNAGAGLDQPAARALAGNRRGRGACAGRRTERPDGRTSRSPPKWGTCDFRRTRWTLSPGSVRGDLPFYDASIGEASVAAINAFARDMGVLAGDVPYPLLDRRGAVPPSLANRQPVGRRDHRRHLTRVRVPAAGIEFQGAGALPAFEKFSFKPLPVYQSGCMTLARTC